MSNRHYLGSGRQPCLTIITVAFLLFSTGCAARMAPRMNKAHPSLTSMQPVPTGLEPPELPSDYRLSPGDVIEVSYYRTYDNTTGEYLLDVGDGLSIMIEDHPELSREDVVIRPDGRISLARVGEVMARGVSPQELSQRLEKAYADAILSPRLTVFVTRPRAKLDEFFQTLLSGPSGASRTLVVRPDGKLSLPFVGEVTVAEQAVAELQQQLNEEFRKIFRYIDVSVNVQSSARERITVIGEVKNPGLYSLVGPMRTVQAVAMAGGYLTTAKLDSVIVLRHHADRTVSGMKVKLDEVVKTGDYSRDLLLQPRDIVYLPMSRIANVNKFVEQYVRGLLPFNVGLGFFLDVNR